MDNTTETTMNENTGITEEEKNKQQEILKEAAEKLKQAAIEAQTAMSEGKGVLKLEKPIRAAGEDVTELAYDFTLLTGMEYAEAMDTDQSGQNLFKITNRQAMNLFATAAGKCTPKVDYKDVLERIGTSDALKGIQLASLFFNLSTRSGNLRISRK